MQNDVMTRIPIRVAFVLLAAAPLRLRSGRRSSSNSPSRRITPAASTTSAKPSAGP